MHLRTVSHDLSLRAVTLSGVEEPEAIFDIEMHNILDKINAKLRSSFRINKIKNALRKV